jgi:branched-chain amino acid transport system substrate-binding protein
MTAKSGWTAAWGHAVLAVAVLAAVAGGGADAAPLLGKPTIKIGVAAALKMPFGQASVRGAEMAAKEINDAGGVLGAKIELVSADTEATAPKATEAIDKLVYRDKVDAIVGAYSSEEATAFQQQSAKLKLVMLFHGTTHILDENYRGAPDKYKYYWNYILSDVHYTDYVKSFQLGFLVDGLKKQLGVPKVNVAVLTDAALWTELMHPGFQDAVKARPDAALVYVGRISRDAVDFTAELTEMRSKNVQLVLCACGYSAGYTLIKQAYEVRLPALFAGMITLSWSSSDFIKAVGAEAAAYTVSLSFGTMPTTPHTTKLIQEYGKVYGGTPHLDVGPTYDGVKAYAQAVKMAGSLDKDKVAEALKKVRLAEGEAWGGKEFRFDDAHRVHVSQADGMILYTYQYTPAGKLVLLAPSEYRTGDLALPASMVEAWRKR